MRNFLCDGHTVAIVDDIEYAELAVALQNVSNEVHRPGYVFLLRSHERILDTGRQAFAQRLSLVEMNRQFASVILAHASMANTTFVSRVFFFDNLAENFVVQGEIGVHLLELGVLFFEFLQLFKLTDLETAVLPFPLIERGSGNYELS